MTDAPMRIYVHEDAFYDNLIHEKMSEYHGCFLTGPYVLEDQVEAKDITYPEVRVFLDRHIIQTMAEASSPFGRQETFYHLAYFTNEWLTKDMVRAIVRDLTDKGYCRFRAGLFNEDGEVGGAGYGLTQKGLEYYAQLCPQPANPKVTT